MIKERKLDLPLSILKGIGVGYAASPISAYVVNKALINNIKTKVEEFKKTLTVKQKNIYLKIEQRLNDLDKFLSASKEHKQIKNEVYILKDELLDVLSRDQIKMFTELEDLELSLSNRLGYTKKATVALGGLLALAIASFNK